MDTTDRVRPLSRTDPVRLGRYRLVGRLGSGGMGVVYLAEDPDGGPVAVKLVHANLAGDAEFRARFRSEVTRARQVPAYCTAEVLDADLDHHPPYLVVEYVDGPSLAEVVDEHGPLAPAHLHAVAVGMATALVGIHGAGVIHRDLKPENVLLAPGSPKVIDFGIARAFEATSRHTRTDHFVGTVAYMAPERFSSEPGTSSGTAADVFAWGCVVAYAGTGRTPFHGDSAPSTAARILTQPPHLAGLPLPLRGPVERALAKNPADRPTAQDLLALLTGPPPERTRAAATSPAPPPVLSGYESPERPRPTATTPPPALSGAESPGRTRTTATSPVPPGGPSPHHTAMTVVLAVLLVVAGLATVTAVLRSDGRVGAGLFARVTGNAEPADPGPSADAASGQSAGGSPGGAVEPRGGRPIIQETLDRPGPWVDSVSRAGNATCVLRGGMRATLAGRGAFACAGPDTEIEDDFRVEVTTTLLSADTCAALWFHYDPDDGGHLLRICQDELVVAGDLGGDRQLIGRIALDRPVPLRRATRMHLVVRGRTADVFRDGAHAGAVRLPAGGPTSGQVQLGISVLTAAGPAAYALTFTDVDIRAL